MEFQKILQPPHSECMKMEANFFFWDSSIYSPFYSALHRKRQVACDFQGFFTQSINSTNMSPLNFRAGVNKFLKILAARSVKWKFHTEDLQILGTTLQNSLTRATWSLEFVRFCSNGYFINHQVSKIVRTAVAVYLCALHGYPNNDRVLPYTTLTGFYNPDEKPNVYWTVHHCNSWGMKNQLDVTCYFISLIMRSTCFGH